MIIVDRALEERASAGDPIRVGMVGAGFMGSGIAKQILQSTPGIELVAVCNRHPDRARDVYAQAGRDETIAVDSATDLDRAAAAGRPGVTDDPTVLTRAGSVDAIVEVTGTVEYAAHVVTDAIDHGTHVVLMNAELDGTVGPYLKSQADAAGVVYTASDGDQPGVQMNLYRFVRGIGVEPLVCGNVKGLQDTQRNPTTQQGFADRWGQNVNMVTSFADGTKISFEQAIVANGTAMTVARRGMGGFDYDGHVDGATSLYDLEELRDLGGVVDYLVGAQPSPGVFVYGTHDDPRQQHYLHLYKLGEGPLYSFYVPYHLCHFEVPSSVARAVDFQDATLAPEGLHVEVVATAKVDLEPGTVIDGMGGYHTYGQCERADTVANGQLLPMGVAVGCRVTRAVAQHEVLTYDDVELPGGRLIDELRDRQEKLCSPAAGSGDGR